MDFRFKVGDLVVTKVGIEECKLLCAGGEMHYPMIFMVIERHTQECPGGVQVHYTLGRPGAVNKFNDIELTLLSDFDVPAMQLLVQERKRIVEDENERRWDAKIEARKAAKAAQSTEKATL